MGEPDQHAIARFYRSEAAHAPGDAFDVSYERAGKAQTAKLTLIEREPAEADDQELQGWGAVVHDITRELVRVHGGSIDVRSDESTGTTFTVVLPRRRRGEVEAEPART